MLNQAKLKSYRRDPIYMSGFQVPRSVKEALEFDKRNRNTKWQDSITLELLQLSKYDTFVDVGIGKFPSDDYKRIRVHFVFAVKHDG